MTNQAQTEKISLKAFRRKLDDLLDARITARPDADSRSITQNSLSHLRSVLIRFLLRRTREESSRAIGCDRWSRVYFGPRELGASL